MSTTRRYPSQPDHLTALNLTGEIGNKINVEVTFQSDGQLTWTDAP